MVKKKSGCRERKQFSEDELKKHWAAGKPLGTGCKKYRVGRMSYGDFFLEPYNPKYPKGRGEQYPFEKGTLWLEKKLEKNKYDVYQVWFEVKR